MSTPYQRSLLRRTFAALAAVAALGAVDVQAQGKVKLNGANGTECSYSSMSITPDGTVTVQCSGTTTPPPPDPVDGTVPGTFTMASAAINATENTTAQVTLNRTGGGLAFTIYYWYTGNGCVWSHIGAASFGAGVASVAIPTPIGAAGTTCTVNLGQPTAPAALGSQTTTTVTATAGSTGPGPGTGPGPIAGCPALPENMIARELTGIGNPVTQGAASGQVVSMKIPAIAGRLSGQLNILETTITAQPATLEFSISKCPGVIDTNLANFCNYRTQNAAMSSITYFRSPPAAPYDNATAVNSLGYCWAADGGDLYVNARWTMPQGCPWGGGSCGYAFQYGNGPY